MSSWDSRPSLSLINAAFNNIISNAAYSSGAVDSLGFWGQLIQLLFQRDIVDVYYSSMVLSMSSNGERIKTRVPGRPIQVHEDCLAPDFDYDFSNINDNGESYHRGNLPYERPCGSYRIALNVVNKFGTDNTWLGHTGNNPGEWPVSYHGTGKHNAKSIAEEGYSLAKGMHFRHGEGIYSTPELRVAMDYATEFDYNGKSYKCVMQNRVNPARMTVIPKPKTHNNHGIYWLSHTENGRERDVIRPYGICLFKL